MGLLVLELVQQLDVGVVPDLGEGALQHVAEGMVAPELVGMHLAVPGDAADAAAGVVALVVLQELEDLFGALGILTLHAHPHIGAVGVVVHGEDLFGLAGVEQGAGLVHDEVQHLTGLGVIQVFLDELGAAARVHQVVETGAGHFQVGQQAEDAGDLAHVPLVDGEAQAHLQAFGLAVGHAFQGLAEGTGHAAETVVHFFHAVQGDAHVGEAHALEFTGLFLGDEGAVGGDDGAHALGGGMAGQFHQVLAHQGLAAREEHDRRAVGGQVVDHGLGLFGADVVGAVHGHGLGVAMHALQVAALGHVPDHHGLLVLGELEQVRGQVAGFTAVTQGVGGLHLTAIQFGNTDHRTILYSESPFVPRRDSGHGAGEYGAGKPGGTPGRSVWGRDRSILPSWCLSARKAAGPAGSRGKNGGCGAGTGRDADAAAPPRQSRS